MPGSSAQAPRMRAISSPFMFACHAHHSHPSAARGPPPHRYTAGCEVPTLHPQLCHQAGFSQVFPDPPFFQAVWAWGVVQSLVHAFNIIECQRVRTCAVGKIGEVGRKHRVVLEHRLRLPHSESVSLRWGRHIHSFTAVSPSSGARNRSGRARRQHRDCGEPAQPTRSGSVPDRFRCLRRHLGGTHT